MSTLKLLKHLIIPHETNNQKAKLIHSETLMFFVLVLIGFQYCLNLIPKTFPSVLGYAANISPSEIISLTNKERAANGLSALTNNKTLDSAALAKGNHMLAKGYWAHFAPDGTSPWSFFVNFGYKYQYAGENLARDFTNASDTVAAWMNSPSHKENILNPHYKEIGIAVVQGNLSGSDTTIVVQFFGSPIGGSPSIPIAKAENISTDKETQSPIPTNVPDAVTKVILASPSPSSMPLPIAKQAKVSPFQSTRSISLGLISTLLIVLSIDLIVVRRKRIARISGRTLAHIAYLSMILAVILLLKAGQII